MAFVVIASDPVLSAVVARSLGEDRANWDRTSQAVVPPERMAEGKIVARQSGRLFGCQVVTETFKQCDAQTELEWFHQDGDSLQDGDLVLKCRGRAGKLLAAERTALNFLQQLSGVATLTSSLVELAPGIKILDTRKTTPGLRDLQKAAVVAGGGHNQRRDLEDQLLLKENHFALARGSYFETVQLALNSAPGVIVGAEASSLAQALDALRAGAHYVLLDNFSIEELSGVVRQIRSQFPDAELEASGGYGPHNVQRLVGTGVDRVSIGALTHSAPALDLSFYIEPLAPAVASTSPKPTREKI